LFRKTNKLIRDVDTFEPKRQITVIQAAAIIVSSIIGVGVLPLPLFAVQAGESGAPMITLIGALFALAGLFLLTQRFWQSVFFLSFMHS